MLLKVLGRRSPLSRANDRIILDDVATIPMVAHTARATMMEVIAVVALASMLHAFRRIHTRSLSFAHYWTVAHACDDVFAYWMLIELVQSCTGPHSPRSFVHLNLDSIDYAFFK